MAEPVQDVPTSTETPEQPVTGSGDERTSTGLSGTLVAAYKKAYTDAVVIDHLGDEDATRAALAHVVGYIWQRAEPDLLAEIERLATDVYKAQDALAFAGECLDIAEREGSPITVERVRGWLEGAKCGRQMIAEGTLKIEGETTRDR